MSQANLSVWLLGIHVKFEFSLDRLDSRTRGTRVDQFDCLRLRFGNSLHIWNTLQKA